MRPPGFKKVVVQKRVTKGHKKIPKALMEAAAAVKARLKKKLK